MIGYNHKLTSGSSSGTFPIQDSDSIVQSHFALTFRSKWRCIFAFVLHLFDLARHMVSARGGGFLGWIFRTFLVYHVLSAGTFYDRLHLDMTLDTVGLCCNRVCASTGARLSWQGDERASVGGGELVSIVRRPVVRPAPPDVVADRWKSGNPRRPRGDGA